MTKPAVLVTGGAGYIGSHAVLALKDAGWHVAVVDDLSNGSRSVVPDDVPFYQGSIAERVLLDSIIDECGIGAIMHFAGSIVVPESVEQPLKYYANNTLASHSLISAAVDAGVKHILFSSTAAVFGAPEWVPIVEDDPKLPINPYGASKLMTERMLKDASAAHPFNYGALRYFNVAGAAPARSARARPTSSRSRARRRSGKGPMSRSMATTIRRPTAPASATISTSATLRRRMSPRSIGWWRIRARTWS
jgi:UDP-glucose 4-epimerase